MEDAPELVSIAGARYRDGAEREGLLDRANDIATRFGVQLQLLDASKLFGPEHIEIANDMAKRAFERGRNRSSSMLVELTVHASGRRQISEALGLLGVGGSTNRVAVCMFCKERGTTVSIHAILEELGLVMDDRVWGDREEVTEAFGIGPVEAATIGGDRWKDLVIERMALVGLNR